MVVRVFRYWGDLIAHPILHKDMKYFNFVKLLQCRCYVVSKTRNLIIDKLPTWTVDKRRRVAIAHMPNLMSNLGVTPKEVMDPREPKKAKDVIRKETSCYFVMYLATN